MHKKRATVLQEHKGTEGVCMYVWVGVLVGLLLGDHVDVVRAGLGLCPCVLVCVQVMNASGGRREQCHKYMAS